MNQRCPYLCHLSPDKAHDELLLLKNSMLALAIKGLKPLTPLLQDSLCETRPGCLIP